MLANPKVLSTTKRSAVIGEKDKVHCFSGQNALCWQFLEDQTKYSNHYSIDLYIQFSSAFSAQRMTGNAFINLKLRDGFKICLSYCRDYAEDHSQTNTHISQSIMKNTS
jgi:hypothetical protein